MTEAGLKIDCVIEFQVDEEALGDRIEGRRIHKPSGRSYHIVSNPPKVEGKDDETGEDLIHREDDTREALSKRLEDYHNKTKDILAVYTDVITPIQGT